jgi:ATP-binding cassette, subfamily C, bacterial CydD
LPEETKITTLPGLQLRIIIITFRITPTEKEVPMDLARRLLALAGAFRGWAALLVGAGIAIAVSHIVQALAAATVFVRLFTDGSVVTPLTVLVAAIAARGALAIGREQLANHASSVIASRLRGRLLAQLALLGPGYGAHSGNAQAMLTDAVDGLQAYFTRYLPIAISAAVTVLAAAAYLFTLDPWVATCVLTIAAVIPLLPRLWDRLLAEKGQRHWSDYSALHAEYVDALQGLTTLKVLGAVATQRERLEAKVANLYHSTMGAMRVSLIDTGLTTLGQGLGIGLSAVVAAFRVEAGVLAATDLFVVLLLAGVAFRPFRELTMAWHAGYLGVSAARDIEKFLTEPPAIVGGLGTLARDEAPAIAFEDVTFTYPGREMSALTSVSFDIRPGSTVALVGRSGSGKTTTATLLQRWFDPHHGRILLAGRDLRDYSLSDLHGAIAVVSQDITLFHGTVADNLRLGAPDASDDDLWKALEMASLSREIATMPAQLKTPLGDRGLALSGGQRQRLAIARALLVKAPVLILDEATAAVDTEAEAAVRRALDELDWPCTRLVIAHRLSTVRQADQIITLDSGRVVEIGSHRTLISNNGVYADLVAAHRQAVSR